LDDFSWVCGGMIICVREKTGRLFFIGAIRLVSRLLFSQVNSLVIDLKRFMNFFLPQSFIVLPNILYAYTGFFLKAPVFFRQKSSGGWRK
jgi:hypothetical protein